MYYVFSRFTFLYYVVGTWIGLIWVGYGVDQNGCSDDGDGLKKELGQLILIY